MGDVHHCGFCEDAPKPRFDGAGPVAAVTATTLLLPFLGVGIGDLAFAVPLVFMVFGAVLAVDASRRAGEPRGAWLFISIAAGAVAAVCALAIVLPVGAGEMLAAYGAGAVSGTALLIGLVLHLRLRLRFARPQGVLGVVPGLALVTSAAVYFVLVPGAKTGDAALTAVAALDVLSLAAAALVVACARRRQDASVGRRLACAAGAILLADGLLAAEAAGLLTVSAQALVASYAGAAWFLASAATSERPAAEPADGADAEAAPGRAWFAARVALPTLQVAAFPVVLGVAVAADGAGTWPIAWFSGAFVIALVSVFAGQAHLVLDGRRAAAAERGRRRDAQRRNEELEALVEQAVRDPLTGVYNRRYFLAALEKEVQRSRRYGSPAALVLFDVDDFKRISDARGHAAGDEVLRAIVAVMAPLMRPVDSFARIGAQEFAVLLPETEQLDALLVAERLRAAVSRSEIVRGMRVTVSGGVGACPADADAPGNLVARTEAALAWAKRNGKDLCAVVNEITDSLSRADGGDAAAAHLARLVAALDGERPHTRNHSDTVVRYAVSLGEALGLDGPRLARLRRAAVLHDVGKVAVRAELLDKPGRLSEEELAEIRMHSTVGAAMLHHAGLPEEAAFVRHHHERVDGAGYPDGLAGEAIPLEARIIFVADAFEAMTSGRPHRLQMTAEQALAELRRCAGSQFEPRLVDAFCALVESERVPALHRSARA